MQKYWAPTDDEALRKAITDGISLQRLVVRFKSTKSGITHRAKHLGLAIKAPSRLSRTQMGYPNGSRA